MKVIDFPREKIIRTLNIETKEGDKFYQNKINQSLRDISYSIIRGIDEGEFNQDIVFNSFLTPNIRIIFATIGIEQDIKNKTNKENEKD